MIDVRNDDSAQAGHDRHVSIVVASAPARSRSPKPRSRLRIPETLLPPKPAATANKSDKPAAKPMSDDERRKALGSSSCPTPAMSAATARRLRGSRQDGAAGQGPRIELPAGRGGRERTGDSSAPVTRTLYLLVGDDPKTPTLEKGPSRAVSVKLGINRRRRHRGSGRTQGRRRGHHFGPDPGSQVANCACDQSLRRRRWCGRGFGR